MRVPLPLVSMIALLLFCTPALAEEMITASAPTPRAAPSQAFEITLGAGYAQGIGDIGSNQRALGDISGAGGEARNNIEVKLSVTAADGKDYDVT